MRRHKTLVLLIALLAVIVLLMALADRAERRRALQTTGVAIGDLDIHPPPGIYENGVRVNLRPFQPRGRMLITVDGASPTARMGTEYEGPLRLTADAPGVTILRAVEVAGDYTGAVQSASYVVGLTPSLPIVSLIAEPSDLWGADAGILANPTWRGRDWERVGHVTVFLDDTVISVPAGLRVDGSEPMDAPKQSLRIYVRREYGETRIIAPLYPDHTRQSPEEQSYKRLLLQAGTHERVWSLLRDQLVTAAAKELALPVVEGRFVWLFINGTSWGIHRLTERVDRFMLEDNYGLTGGDVVFEGDAREGTDDDWDALVDWIEAHDLREPATFANLQASVDLDNLTDYLILYEIFGFPAEALAAVRPEGGRWFWAFEGGADVELGTPDLNLVRTALIQNPEYRQRFAQRAADIVNTMLTPTALDRHLSVLDPELVQVYDHERLRWPGVPTWEDEAQSLRGYLLSRLAAFADRQGLVVGLTIQTLPEDEGAVYVNGIRLEKSAPSWHGVFHDPALVDVIAVASPGYAFDGWHVDGGSGPERVGTSRVDLVMAQDVTLTPNFVPHTREPDRVYPDDVVINEVWINDNGTRYRSLGGRPLEGDWVELLVRAPDGVDLRGWRLTDNPTLSSNTEGSLIFSDLDAFAEIPCGTVILIVATASPDNALAFPVDDLSPRDGQMVLYVENGSLDVTTDPGFAISTNDESLALLAPDASRQGEDEIGVDFVAEGWNVTPYSFGILEHGVTFDYPFRHLGRDDGAYFRDTGRNDKIEDWHVGPSACESGDEECLDTFVLVTPGRLNPGQQLYRIGCRFRQW